MVLDVLTDVEKILRAANDVEVALPSTRGPAESLADIRAQLSGLVYPGFVTTTGASRLRNVVRYLQGISRRLEKLASEPTRDLQRTADIAWIQREYATRWLRCRRGLRHRR